MLSFSSLNSLHKKNILVMGDVMLDIWNYGSSSKLSAEVPLPKILISDTKINLGGAANVAQLIKQSGANVYLSGIVGKDHYGSILKAILKKKKIKDLTISSNKHRTIQKNRNVVNFFQTSRFDFDEDYGNVNYRLLIKNINKIIKKQDLVVISDYSKGTLDKVKLLIDFIKKHEIPILVDPKFRDFKNYKGVDIIKPNLNELMNQIDITSSKNYKKKCFELKKKINCKFLIVTKNSDGFDLFYNNKNYLNYQPPQQQVTNVTGAGDTLCAMIAIGYVLGFNIKDTLSLANRAASESIKNFGTSNLNMINIIKSFIIDYIKFFQSKYSNVNEFRGLLNTIKFFGLKISFINGCFDIIHPGHLQLFKQAKRISDIIVVGLNSDYSIKINKGKNRPINNFDDRKKMILELSPSHLVMKFNEKTPINLIKSIKPDFIIKGSDYKNKRMPESKIIKNIGGKIVLVNLLKNFSTTKIINKIKINEKN